MQKILFIDRDGVILQEPSSDHQIDSLEKTTFVKGAIGSLSNIAQFGFYHVMVTNQDGLGTPSFPEQSFWPYHSLMLRTLEGEGFFFDEIHIDSSFESERLPSRKPGIGMVAHLVGHPAYDIAGSFVIGDRWTDMQLAKNLGAKGIFLENPASPFGLTVEKAKELEGTIVLRTSEWEEIFAFLKLGERKLSHTRATKETTIQIELNLEGSGLSNVRTGLGFFDHMLDQVARHGNIDLSIDAIGDLYIDEHHTIEDTGIALGEAFSKALANKRGMERYGFALPMDDAEAKVLIDFGGRSWLVWDVGFNRERIGDMPTEMFHHFFKSFSDAARCNLNIFCRGDNEHHKAEAIFKAFAKAIKMAIKRSPFDDHLPSTKGVL